MAANIKLTLSFIAAAAIALAVLYVHEDASFSADLVQESALTSPDSVVPEASSAKKMPPNPKLVEARGNQVYGAKASVSQVSGSGPGLKKPGTQLAATSKAITVTLHHKPRSAKDHKKLTDALELNHNKKEHLHKTHQLNDKVKLRMITETELKNADLVEYYAKVNVGSPAQTFSVVMDTGSGILWVPSTLCTNKACRSHTQLDIAKDPSIKKESGEVHIKYGTGNMDGQRATGRVQVAGASVDDQDFLLSTREEGDVFDNGRFDGVMGLGREKLADILARRSGPNDQVVRGTPFYIQLMKQKKLASPIFSMYVSKHMNKPGAVVFGGVNPRLMQDKPTFHKGMSDAYWMLELQSMTVGNNDPINTHRARAIVDSGTSLLVGPSKIMSKILGSNFIKVKHDCSNMKDLKDLKLKMKDVDGKAKEYVLTPEEYVMKRDKTCKTGIGIMNVQLDMDNPIVILGDTFLRKFYSVYNHKDNQVGFALANHEYDTVAKR